MLQELMASGSVKNAKTILDRVFKSYEIPVPLDQDDLVAELTVFVRASLDKSAALATGCKNLAQLTERLLSKDAIANLDKTKAKLLIETASTLGTHIPKMVDATIKEGAFTATPPQNSAIPFLSTSNSGARRTLGSSSTVGARHIPGFRFHRALLVHRGETMLMIHAIRDHADIRDALIEAGFARDTINAIKNAAEAPNPPYDDVDPGFHTIFWPLGKGEYRQISPVPSLPIISELRFKVGEGFREPERKVHFTRSRSYGGKTQNISIELLDSGGRTDLLLSAPPPNRTMNDLERLQRRIVSGQSLVYMSTIPSSLADYLADAMKEVRTPGDRNDRYSAALQTVAATFLKQLIEMRGFVEEGVEIDFAKISNTHERAIVELGPENSGDEHKVYLANRLASALASTRDDFAKFLGDRALPILFDAVDAALVSIVMDTEAEEASSTNGDEEGYTRNEKPVKKTAKPRKGGKK